uniref:Uncharacterized protein n=1 Tax=Arion vulgaris TaxID=1028688 RepID=A0A0B6YKH3_9EUPU
MLTCGDILMNDPIFVKSVSIPTHTLLVFTNIFHSFIKTLNGSYAASAHTSPQLLPNSEDIC